jgi:hypothetical protein
MPAVSYCLLAEFVTVGKVGNNFSGYQTLLMGTETLPETSAIFNQLTLLTAREDC